MSEKNPIVKTEYLAEGLKLVEFKNGEFKYLSANYIWKDKLDKELKRKKIVRLKAGITAHSDKANIFLNSMKRTSTNGREIVFWDPFTIDSKFTREEAKKIQNWKDRIFKDKMDSYRADLKYHDSSIGTEVYEIENVSQSKFINLIRKYFEEALEEAEYFVTGKLRPIKSPTGLVRRALQVGQVDLMVETLGENKFCEVWSPPGTGKTIISYFVRKSLIAQGFEFPRIRFYFADTINNTIQAMYKFHNYHSIDGTILENPYVICSNKKADYRIREAGANMVSVNFGTSTDLRYLFERMIDSESTYNIFCTHFSAPQFLESFVSFMLSKGISRKDIPNEIQIWREIDESHTTTNRHIGSKFASNYRFNDIYKGGIGMTATPYQRPEQSDPDYVYNGDPEYTGIVGSKTTESEARLHGQIADQKVCLVPFPMNTKFAEAIEENRRIRIELGKCKKTGSTVWVNLSPKMVLVKRSIEVAIKNFNRHHIHIPVSLRRFGEDSITMLEGMKRVGILPEKYKIHRAFLEDGNASLERFKEDDFAVVVGSRWMNRGTDTEILDCQISSFIPGSLESAIQTKGRTHRLHVKKDFSLIIIIDFEQNFQENPLYRVIERDSRSEDYNIIGDNFNIAEIEEEEIDPNSLELSLGAGNPTLENITDNDLFLLRDSESNPEFFGNWTTLARSIVVGEYTDENGESLFSRMAKLRREETDKKNQEIFESLISKIDPLDDRIFINTKLLSEKLSGGHDSIQRLDIPDNVRLTSPYGSNMETKSNHRELIKLIAEKNNLVGIWEKRKLFAAEVNKHLHEYDQTELRFYDPDGNKISLDFMGVEFINED